MILITDFHNKSKRRLHTSHLTDKNDCCMAVLIHNNSVKLVWRLNLCKSEPTHMHLYFSLNFPNIFNTSGKSA